MARVLFPEVGHVRALTAAGDEFTLIPSLGNMAKIGDPAEIIDTYSELFDVDPKKCARAARIVLSACIEDGDIEVVIGSLTLNAERGAVETPGAMPESEQIIVARHMMQNGLTGKAKRGTANATKGRFVKEFNVAEHVAAAVVHLGISKEQALDVTMTEMHLMIEAKYPDSKPKDVPSRDEYRDQVAQILAYRKRRQQGG